MGGPSAPAALSPPIATPPLVADHHRAGPDHLAGLGVRRVVAGLDRIAGVGGLLVVDEHLGAALLDRPLVGRILLEIAPGGDVLGGVLGGAALDRGLLVLDEDVLAELAGDLAAEGV